MFSLSQMRCSAGCGLAVSVVLCWTWLVSAAPGPDLSAEQRTAITASLTEFNDLIGGWRGAAQPQRNSTKGAWTEKAAWVWDLRKDAVGLRYEIQDGQALQSALLTYNLEAKQYVLTATLPDKSERIYRGQIENKKLVLVSEKDATDKIHRLTLTRLNEKRTLILLEQRPAEAERYTRVVEIGYTREGTSLATEGGDGPECVVTGGKGTIQVSHQGKTYWVCCTGCRDAFNDDPEGILKEFAEKVAARKAKAAPK